jgi:hypothetical protein
VGIDPVFKMNCHEVQEASIGHRTLLELENGIKYWISDTAGQLLANGNHKPNDSIADQIRQNQSPDYDELYTLKSYDLEPC